MPDVPSGVVDLDDPAAIAAADPGDMLGAVATAGAQLRAVDNVEEGRIWIAVGLPRSVVVAGMGGSAAAGDVLAAVIGPAAPFPVVVHRGYGLPGWVGQDDFVCAVSCSGGTAETVDAAEEAVHRGIRVTTIGAPGSPLAKIGSHMAVDDEGRSPRACLWSLAAPLLVMADDMDWTDVDEAVRAAAADDLDAIAAQCAPDRPTAENPAKQLALDLVGGVPMIWGFSAVASAAATRFGNQIAENAKVAPVVGALSEPHHNQVVAFDGPFAHAGPGGLRLVVLRDTVEEPPLARRAEESLRLAKDAGVPVVEVHARGDHPLLRLTSLIGMLDFASVYLALALGVDPTPVDPIMTLKQRLGDP
jgi:glucose/mannose-6-phosphate isomerase